MPGGAPASLASARSAPPEMVLAPPFGRDKDGASAGDRDVGRKRALELEHERLLQWAVKVPKFQFLGPAELRRMGPELAAIVKEDAAGAAETLAPVYAQRVAQAAELSRETSRQAPVRTPGREMAPGSLHALKWADHKAEELLLSHGYASLRHDPVFGPFMKAAQGLAVDALAAGPNSPLFPPQPIPKRRAR